MERHNIQYYIDALNKENLILEVSGDTSGNVLDVTYDSRAVKDGTMFICKGAHFKADYLNDAVTKGALCYVSEKKYDSSITSIIVKDVRLAMSVLAITYYGNLSDSIKMIGVTGTKGKSTITYFTKYIFEDYAKSNEIGGIGYCSGIHNYDGVSDEESQLTTPENLPLFKHMYNAVNSGLEYMVMEVSSQALKYNRVDGVEYEVACFSNIGEDHISPVEHPSFEDYFSSKLRIFNQSKKACICLDTEYVDRIIDTARSARTKDNKPLDILTYSINNPKANVYGYNIVSTNGNVEFDCRINGVPSYKDNNVHIKLAAFGTINVINALAAISISITLGVPMKYIVSGLSKAVTPGRMQVFRSKDGKYIGLVDYAHNKLSYEMLLTSIKKEFPDKDIVMVFGSSGSKAFNRREILGSEAGKYCKHVVLTEDDGADEDVHSICEEIATYLGPNCTYEIIVDRPEAVRKAIHDQDENTIVIAAGKADESFQKRHGSSVKIQSDVEVMTEEYLTK